MKRFFQLAFFAGLAWAAGFFHYLGLIEGYADSAQPCEALVVLTGSAGRVEHGFKLLEQGRAAKLFITGVGDDRHSEAFLAQYKLSAALERLVDTPGVLSIDREATSTFQNAEQTQVWLQESGHQRLCLITAHYHMPRSLAVFRRTMPERTWIPIASSGWDVKPEQVWKRFAIFLVLAREYNKWLAVTFWYRAL